MGEWTTLAELADLQAGFAFKSSEFSGNSTHSRLLRGDNIAQGNLRWDRAVYWSGEVDERYRLCEGDVVLAMDRPWIDAGLKFASVGTRDLPALLVQRVARLRAKSGVDQRYLHYLVGGEPFVAHILSVQTGTAVPHVSSAQILSFKTIRHPEREQRAIAEVLGALDDKIAANKQVYEILDARNTALVSRFSSTCAEVRLRDVLVLNYGKSLPSASRRSGSVGVYGSGGLVGQHDSALVDGPGVVLGRKGTVGAVYWANGPHYPIDTTYFVSPIGGVSSEVLYYALQRLRLSELNSDSAVPGLNRDEAYSQIARIPMGSSSHILTAELSPTFAAMNAVQVESDKLARTRDELLPLLMSGKLRVKDAEATASAVL